jgi:hypothetical protein
VAKSIRLYTLHAQIRDINPPIWRRIQIEGFDSLRRLHHTLQAALGWTDSHLHEFEIDDKTYAMFELDDELDSMDPDNTFDDRKAKLEKAAYPGLRFVYKYDFADGWEHDIVVEKVESIEGELSGHAHPKMSVARSDIRRSSTRCVKTPKAKRPMTIGAGLGTTSMPNCSTGAPRTRRCYAWLGIVGAESKFPVKTGLAQRLPTSSGSTRRCASANRSSSTERHQSRWLSGA